MHPDVFSFIAFLLYRLNVDAIFCTVQSVKKTMSTEETGQTCTAKYCRTCLKNRYGEDIDALKSPEIFRCVFERQNVSFVLSVPTDVQSVEIYAIAGVAGNRKDLPLWGQFYRYNFHFQSCSQLRTGNFPLIIVKLAFTPPCLPLPMVQRLERLLHLLMHLCGNYWRGNPPCLLATKNQRALPQMLIGLPYPLFLTSKSPNHGSR